MFFRIFSFILICNFNMVFCSINQIAHFDSLWNELAQQTGCDTLVIFDINDVLLRPQDQVLRLGAADYRTKLRQIYLSHFNEAQRKEWAKNLLGKDNLCTLIDKRSPQLIKQLQENGVKVIALTTGDAHDEDFWIQQLKKNQIDFSAAFSDYASITLDDAIFSEDYPIFKKGVLFVDPYSKGQVLQAFLSRINFRPNKVIFVDDKIKNLEEVAQVIYSFGIPFIGLQYMEEFYAVLSINEAIAELQYRYAAENNMWLSDQEASLLLDF